MPQVVASSFGGTAQAVADSCGRDAAGGGEFFWRDGAGGGVERLWERCRRWWRTLAGEMAQVVSSSFWKKYRG